MPKFSLGSLNYINDEENAFVEELKWEIEHIKDKDGAITLSVYGQDDDGDDFYAGELNITYICSPATYAFKGIDSNPRDQYEYTKPIIEYLNIELESVNGNKYPVNKELFDNIYNMIYQHFNDNPEREEDYYQD